MVAAGVTWCSVQSDVSTAFTIRWALRGPLLLLVGARFLFGLRDWLGSPEWAAVFLVGGKDFCLGLAGLQIEVLSDV